MGKKNRPVSSPPQGLSKNNPISGRPSKPLRWTFSFRFWKQIEFFGLSKVQEKWFVSVLEKLTELSLLTVDEFQSRKGLKNYWRYHEINWNQTNIPINRNDVNWLSSDYRSNPEEFPFFQFMVSQALGRIVGFWDESQVFNVVLLDPLHNIQPTESFGYRIDQCSPLNCSYTSLLMDVEHAKSSQCNSQDCPAYSQISKIPSETEPYNVILVKLDDSVLNDAKDLIQEGKAKSYTEIFVDGVLAALERQNEPNTEAIIPPDVFP